MGTDVRIVNMEALTVGPDDRLVLKLRSEDLPPDDEVDAMMAAFHSALDETGLEGRYIILLGNVDVTKVQPTTSPGIPADYADSAE